MRDHLQTARNVLSHEINGLDELREALQSPKTSSLAKAYIEAVEMINRIEGRLIVTGIGKSGHIAKKAAATFASTGTPASYVHPAEASHGDLGMIARSDIVFALSNSGETQELGDVLEYCGRFDIPLVAMTSGEHSALAQAADIVLLLPKAQEACSETKAPTTSTTMSLALCDALAVCLLRDKGFTATDFRNFHPGGMLGAALRKVSDLMHRNGDLPLCPPETAVSDAVAFINRAGFGCVGIIDSNGTLIGMVTDGDLRRHFGTTTGSQKVSEIMTKNPTTVTPDTLAAEALGIISEKHITSVFVVADGKPLGLLHVHDCLSTGVI